MYSIALLCLLPVIAAYNPFQGPCGLSYEEGKIYKDYAAKVKYGLIFSCNLYEEAQKAVDYGEAPDLENGMKFWVTKSKPYTGNRLYMKVLKEIMAEMPINEGTSGMECEDLWLCIQRGISRKRRSTVPRRLSFLENNILLPVSLIRSWYLTNTATAILKAYLSP
ncbi:hypothetical protein Q1695_008066 [Nippostrongylus brasiliensis]|nr:hypothetical protein Q1695_008066 [Nippostrongylus brasiliensis]